MANIYGFDAYGTDLYTQQGGLLLPKEDYFTAKPREVINFTENQAQKQILKQYVKMNGDDLYEVKIPGRPTNVFYNEADAIKNCQNQLTNMNTSSLPKPGNSSIYPHKDAEQYARMLEEQKGVKKPYVKPEVTVNPAPTPGSNPTPAPGSTSTPKPGNSSIYPHRDAEQYARMLEEQKGVKKPYVKPEVTVKPTSKPVPNPKPPIGKNIPWKKIGKWGLIAAVVGFGVAALVKGCSGNKNTAPVADEPTPVKPEEPTKPEETPVTPEQPETPVVPTTPTEPENTTSNAVKGDDYWKYAKMELIAEHQGETGYKPSKEEILERMHEIMDRTKVGMAEDGIHPNPMLKTGDEVQLNEKAAKLRNEAIKQLKEEHKDQKDYKPTYSEVNRKFNELVAAEAEKTAA